MRNAGQVCTSPTRFFVHDSIYEQFLDIFTKRVAETVVGNGMESGVEMGPLANDRRLTAMADLVADARAAGAEVTTGGNRIGTTGYFFEPTVLAHVPEHSRVMQEEPFGPLAVVNPVDSLDTAIEQANSTPFGLAAYGFTNRADYADRMVERVEAGNLSINTLEASLPETPFGGVKSSGYGREGGAEGLHHYTVVKNVSHSTSIVV
jgi:succinate-semialdehyde dehydrogenase/glutarate-semialdehyde dehydrogenase